MIRKLLMAYQLRRLSNQMADRQGTLPMVRFS
jgi:hypothetical protein